MIKEPQKPEKPDCLDSLELFYLSRFRSFYGIKYEDVLRSFQTGRPVCYVCGGSGKVKDTTQRCPVEGLKDADWINCSACGGIGFMHRYKAKEDYQYEIECYERRLEIYNRDLSIYNSIKSKLTQEEWDWI